MALTDHRITAEEYFALPPDDRFTQLIDGEIVVNQPAMRHQVIALEIAYLLKSWTDAAPGRGQVCIPVDVVLDERNVFAPDVWWVAEEHRPDRDARRLYRPPELAVEVRSPSTWRYDIGAKKATYQRTHLPELWLVDTEAEVVIVCRRLQPQAATFDVTLELGAGDQVTSPLLPGFALGVAGLFDS